MPPELTVFVTVGTTLFESLVESASSPTFLNIIASNGFRRIVIQYGKGSTPLFKNRDDRDFTPHSSATTGTYRCHVSDSCDIDIEWEVYRFKPSLEKDMQIADLIISHAGAGSIMEGLTLCKQRNEKSLKDEENRSKEVGIGSHPPFVNESKKMIVVINEKLMNNHQLELAEALGNRGYLLMLTGPSLLLEDNIMKEMQSFRPKLFTGGDPFAFGRLLNDFIYDAHTS